MMISGDYAVQLQVKADGYEEVSCNVYLPSNAATAPQVYAMT